MHFPPTNRRSRQAFTLVELLSVIAVILLFLVLLSPAFSNLSQARQMERAGSIVRGLLENAGISAVGLRTHLWIGVSELSEHKLALGVFMAKDGTSDFAPANLRLADRIIILEGVRLEDQLPAFGGRPQKIGDDNVYRVHFEETGKTLSWRLPGGENATFRCLFEFTPEGTIKTNGQMRRLSELGLAQTTDLQSSNGRAFHLEGITGRIHEYRP